MKHMNENKKKIISKHLSYVLRHKPDAIGLELDEAGWAQIDALIQKSPKISNRDQIEIVVAKNDKRRFIISKDGKRIRANQGHSIPVNLGLHAAPPPAQLFHGTATRFLDLIFADGLRPMNRQYVHLSADIETATKVGQRHGKVIILKLDVPAMIKDRRVFYVSENGVWLTDHVPAKYLSFLDN